MLLWWYATRHADWRMALALAAVLVAGTAARLSWNNLPSGQLAWNGAPVALGYNHSFNRFSLARNFRPADFVTILNGVCGAGSVVSTLALTAALAPPSLPVGLTEEQVYLARWAFALPFAGAAFDWLDGRVARAFGQSSMLGQELDSLADLVPLTTTVC